MEVIVELEKLEGVMEFLEQVNSVPLEEITWTRNGVKVEFTKEELADWKFIGLSNSHFPLTVAVEHEQQP